MDSEQFSELDLPSIFYRQTTKMKQHIRVISGGSVSRLNRFTVVRNGQELNKVFDTFMLALNFIEQTGEKK